MRAIRLSVGGRIAAPSATLLAVTLAGLSVVVVSSTGSAALRR